MMKSSILILALVSSCAVTPANAGGLTEIIYEPTVAAPAETWTGLYGGLSYSHSSEKESSTECFKLGQPRACDDPVFDYYPEYKEEVTTTSSTSKDSAGAFLGYRKDFGTLVLGGELGYSYDTLSAEAQVGLDAGRLLPYAFAGVTDDSDRTYGVGVDFALGHNLLVGLKSIKVDEAPAVTSIRLGWRF